MRARSIIGTYSICVGQRFIMLHTNVYASWENYDPYQIHENRNTDEGGKEEGKCANCNLNRDRFFGSFLQRRQSDKRKISHSPGIPLGKIIELGKKSRFPWWVPPFKMHWWCCLKLSRYASDKLTAATQNQNEHKLIAAKLRGSRSTPSIIVPSKLLKATMLRLSGPSYGLLTIPD